MKYLYEARFTQHGEKRRLVRPSVTELRCALAEVTALPPACFARITSMAPSQVLILGKQFAPFGIERIQTAKIRA